MIEAKPFIWQFNRIEVDHFEKLTVWINSMQCLWKMALSAPFNPEEIPDILKGWERESDRMYGNKLGMGSMVFTSMSANYSFDDSPDMDSHKLPQTLNDFLSDLDRAGITATFKPEWITKNGLK